MAVVLNGWILMAQEWIVHYIQEPLAPSLRYRVGKVLRKRCSYKEAPQIVEITFIGAHCIYKIIQIAN